MDTHTADVKDLSLFEQLTIFFVMIQDYWLGSFILNLLGYALIIVPASFLIRKWKQDPEVKRGQVCYLVQDNGVHVVVVQVINYG